MATWTRTATGTLPSSTGGNNLTGTISLDNGTAPSDFAAANVTNVRIVISVQSSNQTDDGWSHASLEFHDGAVQIATTNGDATNRGSNSSNTLTQDDTTPNTSGPTTTNYENAVVTGLSSDIIATYIADMKNDGGDLAVIQTTQVIITYTPADPTTYETREWRFRNHANFTQGANSTNWGVAVDTVPTLDSSRGFRLRIAIAETTGGGAASESFKLQYRINTGTWTDVAANNPRDSFNRTAVSAVEVRGIQSTSLNNTATTQLLSSPDTFAAGQLKTTSGTGVASPDSSTTEMEWALWFHRYWDSTVSATLNSMADGDTIEFRVQWNDEGTWTTISPAATLSNPSLTVNFPNYHVSGLFVENPTWRAGVHCDTNGNLYHVGELHEADNWLVVHKSTDGGQTWAIQDYADGPTDTDIEGLDTLIDGDEMYIFIHTGLTVKMFRFGLSDHVTPASRDNWLDATGETVATISDATGDQFISAGLRSDGTIVCAYTDAATIELNTRTSGGSWSGSPTTIWNVTSMDAGAAGVVLPTSDDFVMFAIDHTNWDMYAKVWTSADALEDLDGVSVAATNAGDLIDNNVEAWQGIIGPQALTSTSCLVGGIDKTDDDGWVRKITGIGTTHSVGARGNDINTTGQIPETIGLSEQAAASMAVHPSTGDLYLVYATEATAEAATNTLRYRVSTDDGATWGTEQTIAEASPGRGWGDRVENIVCTIYDRTGYKLGIIYSDASLDQQDDFNGTNARWGGFVTGWTWFHEIDVASDISGTAAITETSDTVNADGDVDVSGTAAITELTDSVNADGGVEVSGTAAITELVDDVDATGYPGTDGSAAITEQSDSVNADGSVEISGTAAITELVDSVNADGTIPVSGTAAITESTDAVTATGEVEVSGTAAVSELTDSVNADGDLPISGTSAITENIDAVNADGTVEYFGSAAITELSDSVNADGSVEISGTAAITENVDAVNADGTVTGGDINGSAAITEASDSVNADGGVEIDASAAITELSDSVSASGEVEISGTAAVTELSDDVNAAGYPGTSGTAAITETTDTVSASGGVVVSGTAALTETNDTVAGVGEVEISGTAAVTEVSDSVSAIGDIPIDGSAAVSELTDTVDAEGTLTSGVTGTAAITEAVDTVNADGDVPLDGTAAVTEVNDTVTASGGVEISGTSAITETTDIVTAIGEALFIPISGSAAITEVVDTVTASGNVGKTAIANIVELRDQAAGAGTVTGALNLTVYWRWRFHRKGGNLILHPVRNSGSLTKEGGAAVSSVFRYNDWYQDYAMAKVAAAWEANKNETVPVLRAAIDQALHDAGFVGARGESLV